MIYESVNVLLFDTFEALGRSGGPNYITGFENELGIAINKFAVAADGNHKHIVIVAQ